MNKEKFTKESIEFLNTVGRNVCTVEGVNVVYPFKINFGQKASVVIKFGLLENFVKNIIRMSYY